MDATAERPLTGIDLHCHSTASDGRLSPAELVQAATEAGVGLLALTDHDTVDGLPEAARAAAGCGITLVAGVEISVRWQQRTLHIVGLDVDIDALELCEGLALLQAQRRQRADIIGQKLERLGVPADTIRAAAEAHDGQLTRTHFARLLVETGTCKTLQQAFKRFLAPGKPAYVAAEWVPMTDAIHWIVAANGCAVLAHPQQYRLGRGVRDRLLTDFRSAGGVALEVCNGNSQPSDVTLCADDARRHQLLGSVGSDFHGPEQRWLRLGGAPPLPPSITPVWTRFGQSQRKAVA